MPYSLEIRESVRTYLRNMPLTREGRVRANTALVEVVRNVEDAFRLDPRNRLETDSTCYHFTWVFKDGESTETLYVVVDDATADYGVLRVVYVELL